MADLSIRLLTLAEEAEAAARRFVDTGEPQDNPHRGTPDEQAWRSAYERWLLQLSAAADTEGGA